MIQVQFEYKRARKHEDRSLEITHSDEQRRKTMRKMSRTRRENDSVRASRGWSLQSHTKPTDQQTASGEKQSEPTSLDSGKRSVA